MLPKILTHLNKKKTTTHHHHHHQQQQRQRQQAWTTRRRCWCCTIPLVLLVLLLVLYSDSSSAEKDFNFNDSQVPLLEPKDDPILIDHPSSRSSVSNSHQQPQNYQYHNNHHHHHHQLGHNDEQQDPYAMELSHCRFKDKEIVLSLVLKNYNWHDFNDSRRAKVLEKLSQFFAIPKEFITMESVTKHELLEMQKESLKKGNNKCHNNNNRKLGRVNFAIGCGSKYFTVSKPIMKQIGQQVKDGALDNITGEKFGWWVIWRKQYKNKLVRNRREIEGSGDDDEDDDAYYDYDDDTEDLDTTTSSSHAHRHHHGDDTSEITLNMLEVANNKNDKTIQNNELKTNAINKINGDITALKQTDPSLNAADAVEVEKNDENLSLANKTTNLDDEIVESVSQLESVITKTIENTKNLEDVPDMPVDQSDDDLLSEVLQPLSPIDDMQTTAKVTDNLNGQNVYENPNKEFNIAELNDPLMPTTTTSSPNSLTTIHYRDNSSPALTLAGVNVHENLESFIDSTTPFSLTSQSNRNNYIDASSSLSSSPSNHGHPHNSSHNLEPPFDTISEITTAIGNSYFTPAILTDSTKTTTTTNTPFDSSSTFATSSTSLSSSTFPSPSSSTLLSMVSKKNELTSHATPLEYIHNDDGVEGTGAVNEEKQDLINAIFNEELLNIFTTTSTTTMAIPAVISTKSQQMTMEEQELLKQQQQQQQQLHHHHHHRHQYVPSYNENSREIFKEKATTLLNSTNDVGASLATLSPSASTLDMLAIATAPSPALIPSSSSASASSPLTTASSPLLTPSLETLTASTLDLPIENVFEINIYGKKDETTTEPKDNNDLNKSTTTVATTDDRSAAVTTSSSTERTNQSSTTSSTAEVVSFTTAMPDYVEQKIENTPPMIKSRLKKLAVTSGKSFKLDIPEDAFYDSEDLTNLRLELTDTEGRELKSNSWLQFNAEAREIYGLALDDAVSKWQYHLTATDSGNKSVTETLEISVQQHRGVRTVNHEINVSVKINEQNIPYIDWQLKLINAIATTLGNANTNSIVVREIRASPLDPNTATLVYFNETLPTAVCPERELNNLVKRLDVSRLSDLVQPILGIKSLTGQLIGPCQKTAAAKPKTPTLNIKNVPPIPRNQVDRVVATVGHLLVYKVPSDTFFDSNDNVLTLSLKTKDHKDLSPRHWLQFDSKNEEFYGIPKSGDIGSEEYMLVAEDAGGLTATDALVVQVNHAIKRDFSISIKAYLAIRHEQFNADLQRKFVERIANLFGDASTQNIQIRSVTTHHDSDGTIVNFFNTTLFKSHNRCPEEEMEALRSVYLQDYILSERVKKALGPELNITNVQVIPLGTCTAPPDNTHREFVPNKTDEPLLKSTFSEDYMYTIILPAIIIISMILIASIIACCLHRRRRKSGKMELGDEEERKSFRTKGIPVIFQDELDEKPEIGNKSPIILKDEKPPLLPPSYNTSNMNGDNDVDEYVPPPAVVVGGREARGKSPATPSYRKPPPYVSP